MFLDADIVVDGDDVMTRVGALSQAGFTLALEGLVAPSDIHSRAVPTSRSTPASRANSSSWVAQSSRITASAMSALMWNPAVPAGQYAEHSCPVMVRQGKAAPLRFSCLARSLACGRIMCRQRSASAAAAGAV